MCEEYTNIETQLQKANENNNNQVYEQMNMIVYLFHKFQKSEIERIKIQFEQEKNDLKQTANRYEQLSNDTKIQLNTVQKEKDQITQQVQIKQQTIEKLQTTFSELYVKLEQKVLKNKT